MVEPIYTINTPSEQDINSLTRGLNRIREAPLSLEQAQLQCKKILTYGEPAVLDYPCYSRD